MYLLCLLCWSQSPSSPWQRST